MDVCRLTRSYHPMHATILLCSGFIVETGAFLSDVWPNVAGVHMGCQ